MDSLLYRIKDAWDVKTAQAVVRSRSETVDFIERIIKEFGIPCSFSRRPLYLFSTETSQDKNMNREYNTLLEAGMKPVTVYETPLPFPVKLAIKLDNQAQFQPLTYVRMLAKAIASKECRIFEDSGVVKIDFDKLVVSTPAGRAAAKKIIMATHTPKGFNILQTELGPYREYGIAAVLKDNRYPEGIFWGMGNRASRSARSL